MYDIEIKQGGKTVHRFRVSGPFDPDCEPWRWFDGGDRVWHQCEQCLDVYHYEEEGAPDDSCLCEPCRTRSMRQRIDDEIDRRKEGDAA